MTEKSSNIPLLQLDSILPVSDGWLRCSTVCLLSSLGILTGMLTGVSIDQTVRAQGIIRPHQPYPAVSAPSAAILSNLYISENETVVADQVLADLQLDESITSVVAPQDGVVFQLIPDHVGKMLPAGTPIMQIAPQHPELTLRLRVEPQDIARVSVGQSVKARISAYPYPDYGILKGQVENIAPDVTPCNTCSTAYGYIVNVKLPTAYIQREQEHYPLVPGMDVTVDIVTQRTHLLSIILTKLRLASDI